MLTDSELVAAYKRLSGCVQAQIDTKDRSVRMAVEMGLTIACDLHQTLRRIAGLKET